MSTAKMLSRRDGRMFKPPAAAGLYQPGCSGPAPGSRRRFFKSHERWRDTGTERDEIQQPRSVQLGTGDRARTCRRAGRASGSACQPDSL